MVNKHLKIPTDDCGDKANDSDEAVFVSYPKFCGKYVNEFSGPYSPAWLIHLKQFC